MMAMERGVERRKALLEVRAKGSSLQFFTRKRIFSIDIQHSAELRCELLLAELRSALGE